MKNTKTCPKCGGTRILRVMDGVGDRSISLILGWLTRVPVTRYACTECGYVESWVDEPYMEDLNKQYEKENS